MSLAVAPLSSLSIRKDRKTALFFLIACFFTILVSRGLFWVVFPKKIALMLQLGAAASLALLLFFPPRPFFRRKQKILLLCVTAFIAESLLSAFITSSVQQFYHWHIYLFFNYILLALALVLVREFDPPLLEIPYYKIILCLGWLLFFTATLEQLHLLRLPGDSRVFIVRPASLTGSFLHYPLIMSFFAFISIQWGKITGLRLYFWSGVAFALSTFLVASRSGMFIVFFVPLFYAFLHGYRKSKKILAFYLLLAFVLLCFFLFAGGEHSDSMIVKLCTRITHGITMNARGNAGRIGCWLGTIQRWWDSNMLFGEYAGMITNATSRMLQSQIWVAESGVLQILANFGLVGLILFYGALIQGYRFLAKEHTWLKGLYLAAIIQTTFYQSIEVLPFMLILFSIPLFSQAMHHQSYTKIQK